MRHYGVEEKFVKVCEELRSGVEMRVVMNGAKSRWFDIESRLRQSCPLSPLLFNICVTGMVEESERSQLGFKLAYHWYGTFIYADDIVLVAGSGMELQTMLEVVQAYVMRCRMKLNSRKSKIMVVGKREGGTS